MKKEWQMILKLNELTLDGLSSKSIGVKFSVLVVIFILIIVLGYFLDIRTALMDLKTGENKNRILDRDIQNPINTAVETDSGMDALGSFKMESLKLTGTIMQHGKDWALILTPDNIIHAITTGQAVGVERAKVLLIKDGQVDLMEKVNANGQGSIIKLFIN